MLERPTSMIFAATGSFARKKMESCACSQGINNKNIDNAIILSCTIKPNITISVNKCD
jgi:hypothetical protein